jgi:hypothetical protein
MGAAIIGGLIGGLIAVTYNRSPRHALVIVELPRDVAGGSAELVAMASDNLGLEPDADGLGHSQALSGSAGTDVLEGSARMVDSAATVTTEKSTGGPVDREPGSKAGSPDGHGAGKVAREPRG